MFRSLSLPSLGLLPGCPGGSFWPPVRLGRHRLARLPKLGSPIRALAALLPSRKKPKRSRARVELPAGAEERAGELAGVQEAAPAAHPKAAEARCGSSSSSSARSRGAGTARLAAGAAANRAPSLPGCSACEELGQRREEEEEVGL